LDLAQHTKNNAKKVSLNTEHVHSHTHIVLLIQCLHTGEILLSSLP